MYNSLFFYALKNIKGNLIFSICYTILLSCISLIFYSFIMLQRFGNLFGRNVTSSLTQMLIIIFTIFIIILVAVTFIVIMFIFMELGRMFSTFQIFGAQKGDLLKLVILQMIIYLAISGIFSFCEIFILHRIFYEHITSILTIPSLFISLSYFLYVFLTVFVSIIISSIAFTLIFLMKDPYNSMRGSL